ncbi:hypothetical protein [Microbacterium sp. NPDC087665]|uniref:hypothetical protein n=1 Tax=Microbacterium sp. NPDC087665 TaxID=3364194 RepID=UPI0038238804
MTEHDVDISTAITLYLAHFPGADEHEFTARFPDVSVEEEVRAILLETNRIEIEWGNKTLIEIGEEVRHIMHARHPELTEAALRKLGNYFTYLMK